MSFLVKRCKYICWSKQRVSIARALYADRELLILDEPPNLNPLLEKNFKLFTKKSLKTIITLVIVSLQ